MKPKVTLRQFSAFQGVYPSLLPETNIKSLHANCIPNTPTCFNVIYKKVHRNELTPKYDQFLIQWGHYDKLGNFTIPFGWHILNFIIHLWRVHAYEFPIRLIHIHHNLFITLLLGSIALTVLVKQPCYIHTKMYRLYWKMTIYDHFSI